MLSEDLRPLASSLLVSIEELRNIVRKQVEVLVVNKDKGSTGAKKTFLTPEIMKHLVKFDSLWSQFEEDFLTRVKSKRPAGEAEMVLQLACFMGEGIDYLLRSKLITQDMVNDFDPALIVCLPRIMVLRYRLVLFCARIFPGILTVFLFVAGESAFDLIC